MFENLLQLVQEHSGNAIVNNPVIPNERNEEAMQAASGSIIDTFKNLAGNGNISDIMHMFKGGGHNAANSQVSQQIQGNFVQTLMQKFGLDQGQAGNIASNLIPTVLQKFVHKTNDPNDNSFHLSDIVHNIASGNSNIDVQGILSQFTGGNSGGGIMDSVKNLFK